MSKPEINKNRALFWLNRRIRALETAGTPPSHEDMAHAGLTYAQRQARIDAATGAAEDVAGELTALREAVAFIDAMA